MRSTRRIAVTGASGFIGGAIVAELTSRGHPVVALSRSEVGRRTPGATYLQVGSYHEPNFANLLMGVRTVLHFADRSERGNYTRASLHHAEADAKSLVKAAEAADVRMFVGASSIYAALPKPDLYGQSKRLVEQAVLSESLQVRPVLLRLPPVYGPGGRGMLKAVEKAIERGRILPFALASAPRRFLSLSNLLDLIRHLVETSESELRPGVYEPADPVSVNLADVARAMAKAKGLSARLVPIPFVDSLSRGTIIAEDRAQRHRAELIEGLRWAAPFAPFENSER